jgi:hypothetical protein
MQEVRLADDPALSEAWRLSFAVPACGRHASAWRSAA